MGEVIRDGFGSGSGSGFGSGDGSGYGYGSGYGFGDGSGDGSGSGFGSGDGSGDGSGYGSGYGDGQHDAGLVEMVAVTLVLSSGNKHPYKTLRVSKLKAWEVQKTRAVSCIGAVAAWLDGIGKGTAAAELRAQAEALPPPPPKAGEEGK